MRSMLQQRRDQERMHYKTPEAGIYSLLWIKFYTADTGQLSLNHETQLVADSIASLHLCRVSAFISCINLSLVYSQDVRAAETQQFTVSA